MKIFVLEDNAERIKHFYLLALHHEITCCNNAEDAKKIIQAIKFDIMYLDHDLGEPIDTNNGVNFVKFMLREETVNDNTHVVIHSWNEHAAKNMESLIRDHHPNQRVEVIPFGDDKFNVSMYREEPPEFDDKIFEK